MKQTSKSIWSLWRTVPVCSLWYKMLPSAGESLGKLHKNTLKYLKRIKVPQAQIKIWGKGYQTNRHFPVCILKWAFFHSCNFFLGLFTIIYYSTKLLYGPQLKFRLLRFFKEKFALYVKWCNAAMAKPTRSFFTAQKT